ncbi:MAG: LysM peptidoglycan-binding domain-containing protein [Chloroflexota bacterium]
MMRRVLVFTIFVLIGALALPAHAQEENLLTNGGMEEGEFGTYQGKGRGDLTIPAGWDIWLGQGDTDQFYNRGDQVYAFPHTGFDPTELEGNASLNLSGGYVQFNAAIFQSVGVSPGTNLIAEATSWVRACDLGDDQVKCGSDTSSGAQTRIGIDPDGGTDPNAPEIVWSQWVDPHDIWKSQTTTATATGGTVTVFLFATQGRPTSVNDVYWDRAKLWVGGEGGGVDGAEAAEAAAPPPTERPAYVPFVNAQGEREDGSIVHRVSEGDTVDSIAVAYGITRDDIIALNPSLQSTRFISIGQELLVKEADPEPEPEPEVEVASTPIPGGVQEPLEAEAEVALLPNASGGAPIVASLPTYPLPRASTDDVEEAAADVDVEEAAADVETATIEESPVISGNPDDLQESETAELPDGNVFGGIGNLLGNLSAQAETADGDTAEMAEEVAEVDVAAVVEQEPVAAAEADTEMAESAMADTEMMEESESDTAVEAIAEEESSEAVQLPQVDITASTASVCVSLFEDINQNRLRESNEVLLEGGMVTINSGDSAVGTYETNGTSEPYCFSELEAGEYVAVVDAPAGYGLTTPNQLRLPLTSGTSLNIEFGAAEGVEVAMAPPPDNSEDLGNSADEVLPASTDPLTDNLLAISGIIVAALAGVVVVAGVGASILLRRN